VNTRRHEDRIRSSGQPGIRSTIEMGGQDFHFSKGITGVDGMIHQTLVANGRLYAVTMDGEIHCLGTPTGTAKIHQPNPNRSPSVGKNVLVADILNATQFRQGYGLVLGMSEKWLGLVKNSSARLVGIGLPDTVNALRKKLNESGFTAEKVGLLTGNPIDLGLPRYFANLIVADVTSGITWTQESLTEVYVSLRPYGGSLCVPGPTPYRAAFRAAVKASKLLGARLSEGKGFTL
ncbi:uncharacterized protein METZ01_LOCUS502180, partial [marine metagenome]